MRLSRRRFMVGAGAVGVSAAGLWGLASARLLTNGEPQVQSSAKIPRIGWLSVGSAPASAQIPAPDASFRRGLRDLGYVEGQNVVIEYRWADGRAERLAGLAEELVHLQVDVIAASSGPAIRAARAATAAIPIVMVLAGDPVVAGDVVSLARPGGNVTGLTQMTAQLSAKRLQLLAEVIPTVSRVAVLWGSTNPVTAAGWREVQGAAQVLGLELQSLDIQDVAELDGAFQTATSVGADALFVMDYPLLTFNMAKVLELGTRSRLPGSYPTRTWVQRGGLMSYGADFAVLARRAAYYVDRVLKGTPPADLPVEQPMTFEFVVNMKTARDLGITFPHEIILQITEVVE